MITIDGSHGEGGGQIIRTALALSAMTGKECRIENIRRGRERPGLQAQHLAAVNAMQQLCNANVSGNKIGSTELVFSPGEMNFGAIDISIPTAGSIGLVLQPLMIASMHAKRDLHIKIDGGATHGKWAPPVSYIKNVLLEHLSRHGYRASIEIEKYGYYPKGGALIEMAIQPCNMKKISLAERGDVKEIYGISHASLSLKDKKVAERQAEAAKKALGYDNVSIDSVYYNTLNPGSGVELFAVTENSILGSDALGEMKKSSEEVGKEAAQNMISEMNHRGSVDRHAEDQLLPYIALAGGSINVGVLTEHTKTNIWTIEKFLPVKFEIENKIISCKSI